MVVATAFRNRLAELHQKSQLPATQTFPSNGREELDCGANRSLVVSFASRSHDFMELHQTHKTHDMAKSSPVTH